MDAPSLPGGFKAEDILATLPDGLALVDEKLIIVDVNPALEALAGRSRKRLVGRPLKEVFPGDDRLVSIVKRSLATGRSASEFDRPLERFGHPATAVWVTAIPLFSDQGRVAGGLVVVRDFGNLQTFQEQMRRADRLSSMGVLAAGLAHEIRNPLGGIKGAAQLLSKEAPGSAEFTAVIVREAERIDTLLGQLMDLARPTAPTVERVNIHQVIEDILTLQREAAAQRQVRFEQNYDPSIPALEADPSQLTQVILNLVKNALEASPPGGAVEVSTRMVTDVAIPASGPGGRAIPIACIEVADEGPGIPPGVEGRLFTPFFTTKSDGSGLGLSVANGLVDRHGGRLELTNGARGGAVARCYLPIDQPPQKRLPI